MTRAALAATGLALLVWVAFRLHTGILLEDALITFRYAANLAAGHGYAFNPGEPVQGTTTPLLTLLLAAVALVGGPGAIPTAALVVGLLAGAGAGLCLHRLLRGWGLPAPLAALGLLAFLLHPATLSAVTGGMETPLVALGALGSAALVQAGRWRWAGAVCGLLLLTRVDGLLWVAALGLPLLAVRPARALRSLAVLLAVALPWYLFAWWHFGHPLPHSMLAKGVIGGGEPVPGGQLGWLVSSLGYSGLYSVEHWAWVGLVVLGLAARPWRGGGPERWALGLYLVLYTLAFWLGDAPRFAWYQAPLAWAGLPLGFAGFAWLWRRAGARRPARALLALLLLYGGTHLVDKDLRHARRVQAHAENERSLRQRVGEWLAQNTPAGATVAMEAIGYQGWYSGRDVVDLAGLVSPEVVRLHRESPSNAVAFGRVLRELQPDYLVLRSYEVDDGESFHGGPLFASPAEEARFHATYAELARFHAARPQPWGRVGHLTVYGRRPAERVDTARFAGPAAQFRCSGEDSLAFGVRHGEGELALWPPGAAAGDYLVLRQQPAASGSHYRGDGAEFREHRGEAVATVDGEEFGPCPWDHHGSTWEDARQRGIDLRALGNEPGWVLEITEGGELRLEYAYGESTLVAPAPAGRPPYTVDVGGRRLELRVQEGPCTDDAGFRFPLIVELRLGEERWVGCGRRLGP